MFRILKAIYYFLSPYINSFERKIDKFFTNIKSTDNIFGIKGRLLELMQENLIIVNIWLEKKFKGYKYLDKRTRRKMYVDTQAIVQKLNQFIAEHDIPDMDIKDILAQTGHSFPQGDNEKIKYITYIMFFLRPGLYYHYINTSSFGKLLRNPDQEKLEGDCNQIVTLYIYLYSLKFPINDLQIKLLPEHVCLHFREIDIECTAGQFAKYEKFDHILPVTEIISTNLLDLNDYREDTQDISERVFVKSAELAYAISSLRTLVEKNLKISYTNLAISCMNSGNFSSAKFFAEKAGDRDIIKNVKYNQGVYYFNKGDADSALKIFSDLGDEKMKIACYGKQYNDLTKVVSSVKTMDDAKKYKSTYQKMLVLADKMGDSTLSNNLRDTLSKM